ncbi:hypothetical protein ACFV4Q_20675 [Streptomyces nojiriensis]|uniref:hypothetical protein n=1 Tax=Streptomyces nojiriensis TaxID=66374 RepID=UPI003655A044
MPLPKPLTVLLTALTENLETAAVKDPLVALKALADPRYLIAEVGADAALPVQVGQPAEECLLRSAASSPVARRRRRSLSQAAGDFVERDVKRV